MQKTVFVLAEWSQLFFTLLEIHKGCPGEAGLQGYLDNFAEQNSRVGLYTVHAVQVPDLGRCTQKITEINQWRCFLEHAGD